MANIYTSIGQSFGTLYNAIKTTVRDRTNIVWAETDIQNLMNEGYLDFVRRTQCYKGKSSFAVSALTTSYTLELDVMQIIKASYNRSKISIVNEDYMSSEIGDNWQYATGDYVQFLIQDTENYGYISTYPIVTSFDDQIITIDSDLNKLYFKYNGGASTLITLTAGQYTGDTLATHLATLLNTAFSKTLITVTFDDTNGKFTVASNSGSDTIAFIATASSAKEQTGFITSTATPAVSITSDGAFRIYYNYVVYPTTMTQTTDYPTAIPPQFHAAIKNYTLHNILENEVNQNQNVGMSNRYWTKYIDMVTDCKRFMTAGLAGKPEFMKVPYNFL